VIKPKPMLTLAALFGLLVCAPARAQEKADKPSGVVVPLRMQVVVARYQGEKKISSMPYTLSVNATVAGASANLRMGAKVPVAMAGLMQAPAADAKPGGPVTFNYQDVGTNIDCFAAALDDGRFRVQITVDDSSVYPPESGQAGGSSGRPSFRSFRASNSMVLKDSQTGQVTAATDKVTGETTRIEVTLTVVK
jgi:hypothetical protein